MALTVKRITLWRSEVPDRTGALADVLGPLAAAKADLEVVMGYRVPGDRAHAVLELWPVTGKAREAAARSCGLVPSPTPTLLVEGDDRPGLGHAMTRAIADAGINLTFLVAQVVGRRYSAVVGLENEADAKTAAGLIKKATARKK